MSPTNAPASATTHGSMSSAGQAAGREGAPRTERPPERAAPARAGPGAACSRRPGPAASTAHQARSRRTSTAHQTMRAASTGSVQAWSTWVSVPGASTSTAVTAAARSTRPRASAHSPANSTSDQSEHRPAHVAGEPATGSGEHRHPRQVGEEVLHAGGVGPLLGVDVVAAGEGVGALLQHHPDVDPRGLVADDRDHRQHRVGEHRQGEGRHGGPVPGSGQQHGAPEATGGEHREGRGQPPAAQVAEQRHRERDRQRRHHHGRGEPARHGRARADGPATRRAGPRTP